MRKGGPASLLLRRIRVDPARGGERVKRLPFLSRGPVDIELRSPLTLLVGENGSGKTTLLEAVAARCAIQPGGGRSYAETEDERAETALSAAVDVTFGGNRPKGLFLRADRFAETMARAGRLPMPATGEWRLADEQSRGEGVLSLLTARVDASEGMLFLLDEPETGLSPQRQMALLCLLDGLHSDGRSQALVATHSPILMSHPGCDLLWIDGTGVSRRALGDIQHWRDMKRFMANPDEALERLKPSAPARRKRTIRLWVLSDLHLEAVPHPEAYRPARPAFDVLVVAGDVWEGDSRRALETVARLADGKPAVFVMGNHESWHGALQSEREVARRAARRLGITLLDDSEAEVAGLHFVGGTLWGDGHLSEPIEVGQDGAARLMTEADEAALHGRTRGVIEAAMARPREGKLVVVTHHPPHPTESFQAALWVHGHNHRTIDVTRPDGTRIVCNAAGPGFTNAAFRDEWVVEV
jgi:predicted ATPase/Icc-related predicted phosphoesterase